MPCSNFGTAQTVWTHDTDLESLSGRSWIFSNYTGGSEARGDAWAGPSRLVAARPYASLPYKYELLGVPWTANDVSSVSSGLVSFEARGYLWAGPSRLVPARHCDSFPYEYELPRVHSTLNDAVSVSSGLVSFEARGYLWAGPSRLVAACPDHVLPSKRQFFHAQLIPYDVLCDRGSAGVELTRHAYHDRSSAATCVQASRKSRITSLCLGPRSCVSRRPCSRTAPSSVCTISRATPRCNRHGTLSRTQARLTCRPK